MLGSQLRIQWFLGSQTVLKGAIRGWGNKRVRARAYGTKQILVTWIKYDSRENIPTNIPTIVSECKHFNSL